MLTGNFKAFERLIRGIGSFSQASGRAVPGLPIQSALDAECHSSNLESGRNRLISRPCIRQIIRNFMVNRRISPTSDYFARPGIGRLPRKVIPALLLLCGLAGQAHAQGAGPALSFPKPSQTTISEGGKPVEFELKIGAPYFNPGPEYGVAGGVVSVGISGTVSRYRDYRLEQWVDGRFREVIGGLLFPARNRSSHRLRIFALDDDHAETNETVRISLRQPHPAMGAPPYTIGSPASVTFTLTSDDTPVVSFASAESRMVENATTQQITVILDRPAATEMTIRYALSGTAVEGDDFDIKSPRGDRAIASGSLVVPRLGDRGTIYIDPIFDRHDEGEGDTVVLTLTEGSNYAVDGGKKTHTVTIIDDDSSPRQVSIVGSPVRMDEGGTAIFTLTAAPPPEDSMVVRVRVEESGDYAVSGQTGLREVTIGASGEAEVTVATVNDESFDGHGTLTAKVLSADHYGLGDPLEAVVRVSDNDHDVGLFHLGTAESTFPEGSATIFNSALSHPHFLDGDQTLTAPLIIGGTATLGEDYRLSCFETDPVGQATCNYDENGRISSVTFHGERMGPNENRVRGPLRLEVMEDDKDEPSETLTLSYGSEDPRRSANLTITDAPTSFSLSFTRPSFKVNEERDVLKNAVLQSVIVILPATGRPFTLPLRFTDITATAGEDYRIPANVVFPANGRTRESFDIEILHDTVFEGNETFRMEIDESKLPEGFTVGANGSVLVTIIDDEEIPDATVAACVPPQLRETVREYAGETYYGQAHVDRWMEVLAAFGEDNGYQPMSAATARKMRDQYTAKRWNPVVEALECLAGGKNTASVGTVIGASIVTGAETANPDPDRWNRQNAPLGLNPEFSSANTIAACISPRLWSDAAGQARETWRGPAHVERWLRVMQTFSGSANDAMIVTPAEAHFHAAIGQPGWLPVADALRCMEQQALQGAISR